MTDKKHSRSRAFITRVTSRIVINYKTRSRAFITRVTSQIVINYKIEFLEPPPNLLQKNVKAFPNYHKQISIFKILNQHDENTACFISIVF